MPWKEISVFDQRVQFIGLYRTGQHSITDLCDSFGISRTTGHRLICAYREHGLSAFEDQSRAPLSHPNATPKVIEDGILACKDEHEHWGPKKIRAHLIKGQPGTNWPAASTIGEILKRAGLTKTRRRRDPAGLDHQSNPVDGDAPNNTWCADFKGQFMLGNGQLCYPLTMTDAHCCMLLRCQCLEHPTIVAARRVFTAAFREYGLPRAIRTDNGAPFASTGLGGLTTLAVWWTRLGIRLDRIDKGHPEQNGRHERMHRELKACVASPPAYDMRSQQRACDRFREEYNHIRPHEGIGMVTPASMYRPSPLEYPSILPKVEYPEDMLVRMIRRDGTMRWKGDTLYVSEALVGEPVGLQHLDDRHLILHYASMPLAILDGPKGCFLPRKQASTMLDRFRHESQS